MTTEWQSGAAAAAGRGTRKAGRQTYIRPACASRGGGTRAPNLPILGITVNGQLGMQQGRKGLLLSMLDGRWAKTGFAKASIPCRGPTRWLHTQAAPPSPSKKEKGLESAVAGHNHWRPKTYHGACAHVCRLPNSSGRCCTCCTGGPPTTQNACTNTQRETREWATARAAHPAALHAQAALAMHGQEQDACRVVGEGGRGGGGGRPPRTAPRPRSRTYTCTTGGHARTDHPACVFRSPAIACNTQHDRARCRCEKRDAMVVTRRAPAAPLGPPPVQCRRRHQEGHRSTAPPQTQDAAHARCGSKRLKVKVNQQRLRRQRAWACAQMHTRVCMLRLC